jgi:hypothetical protein
MQIPPTTSLFHALSSSAANPSTAPRRPPAPAQAQAAREAARAVFAQLKTPAAGTPGTPAASTPTTPSPAVPTTQPRRNLPRGSIINILV